MTRSDLHDRGVLYRNASAYFDLGCPCTMKLSAPAAAEACGQAAEREIWITIVEGGIWRDPGFEARIDCIWHAGEPPNDLATLRWSNAKAAQFIADRSAVHDVFVLTASGVRMR